MNKISISELLKTEAYWCFVCGNKKYREFYFRGHIYRVCFNCLKTRIVKDFFK